MDSRAYFLGFSVFPGIGPQGMQKLLTYFGSAKGAWTANEKDLKAAGLSESLIGKLFDFRTKFSLQEYAEKLKQKHVDFVTTRDEEFPKPLRALRSCPFVLYFRGNKTLLTNEHLLAVVGTRKITGYGHKVTEQFVSTLVDSGFVIVSGLALGVDAVAHQTTLASGGQTIAVLGSGVDICFPASNRRLYESILEKGGLIVSEYPLGMAPSVGSFPARNRIIAGLSQGVLVTEGALDSGSLITAEWSLKLGRPVFAVPGPVTSTLSQGPYALLEKGALLSVTPDVVLRTFSKSGSAPVKTFPNETADEKQIRLLLSREPMDIDTLVRETARTAAETGVILSLMEMKGWIRQNSAGQYELVS